MMMRVVILCGFLLLSCSEKKVVDELVVQQTVPQNASELVAEWTAEDIVSYYGDSIDETGLMIALTNNILSPEKTEVNELLDAIVLLNEVMIHHKLLLVDTVDNKLSFELVRLIPYCIDDVSHSMQELLQQGGILLADSMLVRGLGSEIPNEESDIFVYQANERIATMRSE